jgi:type VI secretion system protein ImpG
MQTDELLQYYQEELALIRRLGAEFAATHPKIAGRLRLDAKTVEDPHVARLIEAFALSNARIRHKLDDEFPEITDALLEALHPHYLAPIPAMSVIQFQPNERAAIKKTLPANEAVMIEGAAGRPCQFTTRYPVELLPVTVKQVSLTGKPIIAPLIPAMNQAVATLRLSLKCTANTLSFAALNIYKLRFFINAPAQYAYALYELLFKHTLGIAVAQSPTDSQPILLPKNCLQQVGFNEDDGMLPYSNRTFMGYRLLTEFFAFPEKFLFFDLNQLERTINTKFTLSDQQLEIYFYLDRLNPLLEKNLQPHYFALGCTPIVNLFEKTAEPLHLTHTKTKYHLIPDANQPPEATEIHTIKRVVSEDEDKQQIEYQPFYGTKHYQDTLYYHADRNPGWLGSHYPRQGSEIFLSFVNLQFKPLLQKSCVVTATVYCTNRDLPAQLPFGGNEPRVSLIVKKDDVGNIRCLLPLTPTRRPALDKGARWRYVSHLNLNHLSLTHIEALQGILKIYDFDRNNEHQYLLEGLLDIHSRHMTARNPYGHRGNVFWQGTEIKLLVDETKFSSTSLYLLGCILDHFFALYTTLNSFTQLIITTRHQGDIHSFPPRVGDKVLI